ncbi:hypothetical protein [Eisenibacter elegans]|jgi:hypothetical protein|uniref:hypothetical protein n=1 Tax=Eisenibacter elegans TaxID=997 RepID=UPI000414F81D|nr:hypothetical protein [Eisenibacter elegans]
MYSTLILKAIVIIGCLMLATPSQSLGQNCCQSFDLYSEVMNEVMLTKTQRKDAQKRTGYQNQMSLYAYQHANGYITVGDHDRVNVAVYDQDWRWIETHIGNFEPEIALNKQALQQVKTQLAQTLQQAGYTYDTYAGDAATDLDYLYFSLVQNKSEKWYEVRVYQDDTYGTVIITQDFRIVRFQEYE